MSVTMVHLGPPASPRPWECGVLQRVVTFIPFETHKEVDFHRLHVKLETVQGD